MASPGMGFSWGRRHSASGRDNTSDNAVSSPLLGAPSPARATAIPQNIADPGILSSSTPAAHREPIRSFVSGSIRDTYAPIDSAQYAASVREDTAELASYFLSDKKKPKSSSFLTRPRSQSSTLRRESSLRSPFSDDEDDLDPIGGSSDTIVEVSEPPSPGDDDETSEGPSVTSNMLRRSPPESYQDHFAAQLGKHQSLSSAERSGENRTANGAIWSTDEEIAYEHPVETTPLLKSKSHASSFRQNGHGHSADADSVDIERQKPIGTLRWFSGRASHLHDLAIMACHPKRWDSQAIMQKFVIEPVKTLPAVFVGLILNILDALSYGMILFPLGNPIFANLGPAGISIFYVSTIMSQLVFSSGSIFKGGVGSELIEVVPFFHNMASTITSLVGEENPEAVIATTIFCFSFSALITGAVFFAMGALKFGYLVGFIPRHILIGCIGGVGWFLVQTGFEVSARLEGSFHYDLETLRLLFRPATLPLWTIPLGLAITLFVLTQLNKFKDNHYVLPTFICLEPAIFWFFVVALDSLQPESLRGSGWIFEAPPAGETWWYFYTLFKFKLISWEAVAECIPAMLALTFFGVLHVPINVPALALQTGEDHADLDRELKLHGLSNFLSGCAGSIQNYLVYANSQFFIKSGGNSRMAGYLLAAATGTVMIIGPVIIGFIPVMMVGTLIFVLGFELLMNALWDPRKKLNWLEYWTVVVIVLVMGMYDFVVGIGIGVILAFVSLIFQASRVSAIRSTYSGEVVGSTVRRNPSQQHYLQKVGNQVCLMKLAGFLFFGTIVSVEEKIRHIIADEEFSRQPIRFLVLDLTHVTGLDYSAGEAFGTVSRLLAAKNVSLVISGVDLEGPLGRDLLAVGLGSSSKDTEVHFWPNLNLALESCENELLRTLYVNQEAARSSRITPSSNLDVPVAGRESWSEGNNNHTHNAASDQMSLLASSPRRSHLHQAAREALSRPEVARLSRWQNFKEPLRLMLQIFEDLSDKNEDFWVRAKDSFQRVEVPQGDVLFRAGDSATGFYLVESGILRCEYHLPQGLLLESIAAGTTCGELPFFSETPRTATVSAERDCIVWLMSWEAWEVLQRKEPDVARELLRVSLKLTSERMSSITSYVLTTAT
ncbi:cyclic nucleotide-binding domain-containing protein [Coniella lustricola]|uniref:Cyclic nucleotide-binding domain-containing protein n=1 Tax=Coniella lustricola TaxID=2025994 RepID=A0A2T3AMD0_9PEZI|nr:cyclic nucleotide-binding domain-containing protein [Coniella lustricola]